MDWQLYGRICRTVCANFGFGALVAVVAAPGLR
jgi:hypothetical protein